MLSMLCLQLYVPKQNLKTPNELVVALTNYSPVTIQAKYFYYLVLVCYVSLSYFCKFNLL